MAQNNASRTIDAPIETVFAVVSDINNFSKAIPQIVRVEILSDVKAGVGTRFRETRLMRGREATSEMEVTELVENEHIRIVSDEGGTIWDTVFAVTPVDAQTELTLVMDARPYKLTAKLMSPFVTRFIQGALEGDMDAVKAYCEQDSQES